MSTNVTVTVPPNVNVKVSEREIPTTSTPEIPRIKVLSAAFVKNYPATWSRTCFVLGSTGECGKRLARDLINSGAFSLIKLIARRPVPDEFIPDPVVGVKIVSSWFIVYLFVCLHLLPFLNRNKSSFPILIQSMKILKSFKAASKNYLFILFFNYLFLFLVSDFVL